MTRKRVAVAAVLDAVSDRELGRAIQRTLESMGDDASKARLGRRFKRELSRRVSRIRIHGRNIEG